MSTTTRTLDAPELGRSASGYIVAADDTSLPYPRIGDVTREGRKWIAEPMWSFERVPCFTRAEAVRFVCECARDGSSAAPLAVGVPVRAIFPNGSWGEGVVCAVIEDPKYKPYQVLRADGKVGHFQRSGLVALQGVDEREAYIEAHLDAKIAKALAA